jgi:hypothetical protein
LAGVSPHSAEAEAPGHGPEFGVVFAGHVNPPACETYGTAVEFLSRPADAARQALHEDKLLFALHVSGNFEDAKFT